MVRDPATLTCKEVVELITEFLSNALSPEDRVRLEQHLLVCPPCTLHLGQVQSTIEVMARLRTDTGPTEVDPALLRLFRQWKDT